MRPLAIALVFSLACASTREAGHLANEPSPSAEGKTATAQPGAAGAQPGAAGAQPGAAGATTAQEAGATTAQEAGATTAQEGKSASQPHDGARPQSDPAQSRQSASPASATATTASEAAAAYAHEHGGGGGGDAGNASGAKGSSRDGGQGGARDAGKNAAGDPDESCESDADCGFTNVGPEETACCPMLCSPRVVSKKHAGELRKRIASCNGGRECPQPSCRPPPHPVSPACEAHRCVGKPMKASSERD